TPTGVTGSNDSEVEAVVDEDQYETLESANSFDLWSNHADEEDRAVFDYMVIGGEMATCVTETIYDYTLCRIDLKTLFIVDEHSALFHNDNSKPNILTPLTDLNIWLQERNGARVVFTGMAHANYERRFITSDIKHWVEFVTPHSDFIFDKLLAMSPILARETIKGEQEAFSKFNIERIQDFYSAAGGYFKSLNPSDKFKYRRTLVTMFRPREDGNLSYHQSITTYKFMDLGLVYRLRDEQQTMYHILCPAAQQALLDVYRSMPLSLDLSYALRSGDWTSDMFEDAVFFCLQQGKITLGTTNLAGVKADPLVINAEYTRVLTDPPSEVRKNTLLRCHSNYPIFDFIYNRIFIQMSPSDFDKHNKEGANISKAFSRPNDPQSKTKRKRDDDSTSSSSDPRDAQSKSTESSESNRRRSKRKKNDNPTLASSFDSRNQIEKYLDSAFGGNHRVIIGTNKGFEATKDGVNLDDFKIVYICGEAQTKKHLGEVKDFPDIVHVNLKDWIEERQASSAGSMQIDILMEQQLATINALLLTGVRLSFIP
ncbi:hypothetical protein BGZ65_004100, partial [Modicella reniformis]